MCVTRELAQRGGRTDTGVVPETKRQRVMAKECATPVRRVLGTRRSNLSGAKQRFSIRELLRVPKYPARDGGRCRLSLRRTFWYFSVLLAKVGHRALQFAHRIRLHVVVGRQLQVLEEAAPALVEAPQLRRAPSERGVDKRALVVPVLCGVI